MTRSIINSYELVIFDMDGVLADTSPCHRRAYNDLWSKIGVQGPAYETIAGRTTNDVVTTCTKHLTPSPAHIDEWVRFKQERARDYLPTAMISYSDTAGSLAAVAREGIPLALGTGASRRTAEMVLKQLGIFEFFSLILTGSEVQNGKPAPDIYSRLMVQAAACPKRTLVIEDSLAGLEAAVASGAYAASVRTGREIAHSRFLGSFRDLPALLLALGIEPQ
jgi:HAD superfamily hydrolase (TIGR01509 family)